MTVIQRKERERNARLKLIINAASDTFAKLGYHKTSMDLIAEKAELGKSTLYYYFRSKEALLITVLETGLKEFFETLENRISSESSTIDKIKSITITGAEFFSKNKNFFNFYVYLSAHPSLRKVVYKKFQPIIYKKLEVIKNVLQQAQKEKLIEQLPIEEITRIYGSLVMSMGIFTSPATTKKQLLKRAEMINEIFLNGIKINRDN